MQLNDSRKSSSSAEMRLQARNYLQAVEMNNNFHNASLNAINAHNTNFFKRMFNKDIFTLYRRETRESEKGSRMAMDGYLNRSSWKLS